LTGPGATRSVLLMSENGPLTRNQNTVHPIPAPKEATHFRLRKGGKMGADQLAQNENGVTTQFHKIEDFDKDTITSRWGFSRVGAGLDYWVQFSREEKPGTRQTLGVWKPFAIAGEEVDIDPKTGIEVMPGYPGFIPQGSPEQSMGFLVALKGLADTEAQRFQSDANARVAEARLGHEAALAATRTSHDQTLQILGMFFKERTASVAPATDPNLMLVLKSLADGQAELRKFLIEEEEPEEPPDSEEVDYARYAKLVRDVKRDGLSALLDYAKERGGMALVDAIPAIKAKLPDIYAMAKPMLEAKINEMLAGLQQPAPAPVQHAPRRRTIMASPTFAAAPQPLAPPQGVDQAEHFPLPNGSPITGMPTIE
jgi:hypothetical protein